MICSCRSFLLSANDLVHRTSFDRARSAKKNHEHDALRLNVLQISEISTVVLDTPLIFTISVQSTLVLDRLNKAKRSHESDS